MFISNFIKPFGFRNADKRIYTNAHTFLLCAEHKEIIREEKNPCNKRSRPGDHELQYIVSQAETSQLDF